MGTKKPALKRSSTPAVRLIPIVTLDGTVQGGKNLQLNIVGVGGKQGNLRVKLMRLRDSKVVFLSVSRWTSAKVVAAIPASPFDSKARMEEVVVGLCDANNNWVGNPIRTAFVPERGPRVGHRPRGCENPDWDGDGQAAIECGGSDCDDGDGRRYPGAPEVCDQANIDEDCDPTTFGVRDADRDGATDAACCNVDPAGGRFCGNDCDDRRPGVHFTATEVCDQVDNDCDSYVDEGVQLVLWTDRDGDGFGDPNAPVQACGWRPGLSYVNNDCNDTDPKTFKGHGCD